MEIADNTEQVISEAVLMLHDLESSSYYRTGKVIKQSFQLVKRLKFDELLAKLQVRVFHPWVEKDCRSSKWAYKYSPEARDRSHVDCSSSSITVYTCVTGGYESHIIEPLKHNWPNCRYIIYSDNPDIDCSGWDVRPIPVELTSLTKCEVNRYIKLHPAEFIDTEFSVYVDGNIWLLANPAELCSYAVGSQVGLAAFAHGLRDCFYQEAQACKILGRGNREGIDAQVLGARSLGIEDHCGLIEAGVLVSDLTNKNCIKLYDEWWNQFMLYGSGRDQLAFPCALKKIGQTFDAISIIGSNFRTDSRIIRREHL